HYRLQPLGYAIGSVPFRLFAQSNQPLISARTQMNHSGKHGTPPTGSMPSFYLNVPLLMRVRISAHPVRCPIACAQVYARLKYNPPEIRLRSDTVKPWYTLEDELLNWSIAPSWAQAEMRRQPNVSCTNPA